MRNPREPLLDGFRALFGSDIAKILAAVAVIGLIASFHTIIFAYGRQIYSLSRAGYFPAFLSVTHGTRKSPHVALIAGAVLGLAVMMIIWFSLRRGRGRRGHRRHAAQYGGCRRHARLLHARHVLYRPEEEVRASASALYEPVRHRRRGDLHDHRGASRLYFQLTDPVFPRLAVFGVVIYYAIMMAYFLLWGRHKLILSPEEEFARDQGREPSTRVTDYTNRERARRRAPTFPIYQVPA